MLTALRKESYFIVMKKYLQPTEIINWQHPKIFAKAKEIASGITNATAVAKSCFEWVRDKIKHIDDYEIQTVACSASEVLKVEAGICYAKSHLLAALLRANSIPTGFCYQRLRIGDNGPPFCLHGLNAIYLPHFGWYRIDARGNKPGVNAQFTPPTEQLAFSIRLKGECDFLEIWPDPLPLIIQALRKYKTRNELWGNLPDIYIVSNAYS
jgi:transglutaminase-like putative cysteine protease